MPFTFKAENITDIKAACEKLEEMAKRFNGMITGDDIRGDISANGFEGSCVVGTKSVRIAIRKTPIPFVSNRLAEHEIKGFLVKLFYGYNA